MLSSLRIRSVRPDKGGRVLAVSDIHGDLMSFHALLRQIAFSPKDTLFLVGDILRKGTENLAMLREAMALERTGRVHTLMGNNEFVGDWLTLPRQAPDLLLKARTSPHDLPAQMAREIGLGTENISPAAFQAALREPVAKEIAFLKQLPHLIETPGVLFAHSGLSASPLREQAFEQVLWDNHFYDHAPRFEKPLIVGHMPACNLSEGVCCCNPLFDFHRNIVFIDGGNNVKRWGQLNALLLPRGTLEDASFEAVDRLPKARAVKAQEAGPQAVFIRWPRYGVELLERNGPFSVCRDPETGRTFRAPSALVSADGLSMAGDYTDYRPALAPGDILSVVELMAGLALVKREGVVGWTTPDHFDMLA